MFLSLISFRLTNLTGEIHNLTYLGGNHIKEYTKSHYNSVIIFCDKPNILHFAKFAITFYKNISFARASERDGQGFGCTRYPCLIPFQKGRKIKDASVAPYSAINFTRWCKQSFDITNHYIEHPEVLRQILESKETIVIGVGVDSRPEWLPSKFHFFMTNSQVFEMLKINVSNGIYSYSAKTRIMHEIKDPKKHDYGQYISSLADEKTYNKKFWGGFTINPLDTADNAIEFTILNDLGKKYSSSINLVPIYDSLGWDVLKDGRVTFFDIPFFVVFESHKNMSRRWVITNKTLSHDKQYVDNFLKGIINGSIKHTIINEDEPEQTKKYLKPLTTKTFWSTLKNNTGDSLVLFTSFGCTDCLKIRLVVNKTASLLRENNIRLYHFNCSLNEIPGGVKIGPTLPCVALFRKEKLNSPLFYNSGPYTEDLIDWLKEKGTEKLDVPPFDIKKVRDEIADEYYKYAPPTEFVVTKTEKKYY